ncbi:MAG: hypothetical protein PHQ98_00455 [Candidatus ainarchaeum sp.]|nr:hypothetical protein [Candidatus ainarchaeum sp.]
MARLNSHQPNRPRSKVIQKFRPLSLNERIELEKQLKQLKLTESLGEFDSEADKREIANDIETVERRLSAINIEKKRNNNNEEKRRSRIYLGREKLILTLNELAKTQKRIKLPKLVLTTKKRKNLINLIIENRSKFMQKARETNYYTVKMEESFATLARLKKAKVSVGYRLKIENDMLKTILHNFWFGAQHIAINAKNVESRNYGLNLIIDIEYKLGFEI